jgi:hypothetical protein
MSIADECVASVTGEGKLLHFRCAIPEVARHLSSISISRSLAAEADFGSSGTWNSDAMFAMTASAFEITGARLLILEENLGCASRSSFTVIL